MIKFIIESIIKPIIKSMVNNKTLIVSLKVFCVTLFFGVWLYNYVYLINKIFFLTEKQILTIMRDGRFLRALKLFNYLSLDFVFNIFIVLIFVFLYYIFVQSQISIKAKKQGKFKKFNFPFLEFKLKTINYYIYGLLCFAVLSVLGADDAFMALVDFVEQSRKN